MKINGSYIKTKLITKVMSFAKRLSKTYSLHPTGQVQFSSPGWQSGVQGQQTQSFVFGQAAVVFLVVLLAYTTAPIVSIAALSAIANFFMFLILKLIDDLIYYKSIKQFQEGGNILKDMQKLLFLMKQKKFSLWKHLLLGNKVFQSEKIHSTRKFQADCKFRSDSNRWSFVYQNLVIYLCNYFHSSCSILPHNIAQSVSIRNKFQPPLAELQGIKPKLKE